MAEVLSSVARLSSPIPLEEFEPSIRDPLQALTFPPEAYTSEAFFRFEMAAVWEREWICVGRQEEVPNPGDYYSINVLGEPLLIVRASSEDVVAMSAVCRHRCMLVAEGYGNCRRAFVCPYHNWTYDHYGRLISGPQMSKVGTFDKANTRLPPLETEVWKGFIFVNFADHPDPLAPRLQRLETILANYGIEELQSTHTKTSEYQLDFEFAWNWKVYLDGQTECYHCSRLHKGTCFDVFPTVTTGPYNDVEHGVFTYELTGKWKDAQLNHLGRSVFPVIETLTDEERWLTKNVFIAPGLYLGCTPDNVQYVSFYPNGVSSVGVRRDWLYPARTLAREDFWEVHAKEQEARKLFFDQDVFAFDRVQRGLRSRFASRGAYSAQEDVMIYFNRWLVSRYRKAEGGVR